MAFGHIGRPSLPLGKQASEIVHRAYQLVPDQQFGSPSRSPGPALQEGHQRFAAVIGRIQGGEVGDLECHEHQTGAGRDEVDDPGAFAVGQGEAQGEHRGSRLGECGGERLGSDPPADEGEAKDGQGQPGDQEGDEGDGLAEQQDPVLGGVRTRQEGALAEHRPDDDHRVGDPAGGGPRHDQHGQHAVGVGEEHDHSGQEHSEPHGAHRRGAGRISVPRLALRARGLGHGRPCRPG